MGVKIVLVLGSWNSFHNFSALNFLVPYNFQLFLNFYNVSPFVFYDVIMFTGYKIISVHIELGKFVPISGKSLNLLYKNACLHCAGFDPPPPPLSIQGFSPMIIITVTILTGRNHFYIVNRLGLMAILANTPEGLRKYGHLLENYRIHPLDVLVVVFFETLSKRWRRGGTGEETFPRGLTIWSPPIVWNFPLHVGIKTRVKDTTDESWFRKLYCSF